jgi:undecaprenyl-diphosphatase
MFIDIGKVLILGIVEGVTEFLPVSSTGHLILANNILSFTGERAKVFDVFIQSGAIMSVLWLYRIKIISVITGIGGREENRFIANLIIAFIPAALIGLKGHSYIKRYLFNSVSVAMALIVGGILMLIIEKAVNHPFPTVGKGGGRRISGIEGITPRLALCVGLAQAVSLFPGVSRSAATIMGGLLVGFDRKMATEFSFFLAIPTMFAATSYDLLKGIGYLTLSDLPLFITGFIVSFISALLVIKAFLRFLTGHTFSPFAYYRIIFGILILLLL